MSLARARTWPARSGDKRTNHDTTARLQLFKKVNNAYLENCRDVVDFAFDVCQVIDYLRDLFTRHILLST